ncbi:hypothetical protein BDP27DRAFT_1446977 [Rhodocollybia butyracea]|uniref:Uncharacterized protein n=1 Tax=Rhodocollybia butyracea TaxID=206335 RepID=A0A9P5PWC6_9AGAR|nr:hypothetical protein BDP27DRAFT_1446977 [Rhodocollybia butyracea]
MSTTKFSKLLEWYLSPSTCGRMIMCPVSTICSFAVINQLFAACSLDVFQSPSWLAPAAFLLAGVIVPRYRLAHKAYATITQYIHIKDHLVLSFLHDLTLNLLPVMALLALVYMTYLLVYHMLYTLINSPYTGTCHSAKFAWGMRVSIFPPCALAAASRWFTLLDLYFHPTWYTYASLSSELGGCENTPFQTVEEVVLFKIWAQPEFIAFLNAFEFHLPAIKATAHLLNLTTATRERHDREVQTLRNEIDKYRAFSKNSEAVGQDTIEQVKGLKRTIALSFKVLKLMKDVYPCIQQSDKDKLDKMFRTIENEFDNSRFSVLDSIWNTSTPRVVMDLPGKSNEPLESMATDSDAVGPITLTVLQIQSKFLDLPAVVLIS